LAKLNKLAGSVMVVAMVASLLPAVATAAVPAEGGKAAVASNKAEDRLLVKVKAGANAQSLATKHGAQEKKALGTSGWKVFHVPAGQVDKYAAALANDANVEAVEFDYIVEAHLTPNDPAYGSQYHHKNVQSAQAWDISTGSNLTIAIVDTGVDINHADLKSKLVAGYDFVNNDSVADDDNGHGTHCAGIATATGNNGTDGVGIDWSAKIMPIKVLNRRGSGYTSDIIDGVYWAADRGANVISMSLGGGSKSSAFQSAITYAWNKGAIVVAAAGNSSTSTPSYPAAYDNVVSVASTTSSDVMSSFSNYGSSWVDVAAPGSSIYATRDGGGMTTMSGTSMATPVVAGLATLTWSVKPGASNATIVNRIYATTDSIAGTGTSYKYGRVNAYKALNGF